MWTTTLNKSLSLGWNLRRTRDIRNSQSSRTSSTFLMLLKTLQKQDCFSLRPFWWNIVSRVTTLLSFFHKNFPIVLPAYKGLSLTGGNWPRSPTRMMDMPPKGQFFFSETASHNRASICIKILDPRNLISSINIYLTCFISSWNTTSYCPCSGCISLIGIFRAECIIFACILKVVIPVEARRSKGFLPLLEKPKRASKIKWIR